MIKKYIHTLLVILIHTLCFFFCFIRTQLKKYICSNTDKFQFLKDISDETCIESYLQEFKRFLILKAINEDFDDERIHASVYLDHLWTALMTLPNEYFKICQALFSNFTNVKISLLIYFINLLSCKLINCLIIIIIIIINRFDFLTEIPTTYFRLQN